MDPGIVRQLGVECGDEHCAVPEQHRLAVELREHLDARPGVAHARCADEHAAEGPVLGLELEVGLEARDLAAVGVAVDVDVGQPEVVAIDEDHPRAGTEDRPVERPDRLVQAVERREAQDRRRLAARDHQAVEPGELLGQAHLDDLRARLPQDACVLAKGALERQNAYPGTADHVEPV